MHYIWDPIGVSDVPEARDEYASYLPQVFALVRDGADHEKVARFLLSVETQQMGLPGAADGAREAARILGGKSFGNRPRDTPSREVCTGSFSTLNEVLGHS
jgi:hypothetical protein